MVSLQTVSSLSLSAVCYFLLCLISFLSTRGSCTVFTPINIMIAAENARVMVLAATNRPSDLDEAILRRFSQAFEIGLPDQRERTEIMKVILKGERTEDNIDFEYLASMCEGYTGSDILELCKKAAYFPIRDLLNDEKKGKPSRVSASIVYVCIF